MTYVKQGWGLVRSQFPSVIILFLYQLLWGFFLYRFVNLAVIAVLSRYPDPSPTEMSRLLYGFEAQLALQHNAAVHQYLWILLGMIGIRILLSPLLEAGILYGLLPQDSRKSGLPLFRGMKEFWKPVTLFYVVELAFLSLPFFWIGPRLLEQLPSLIRDSHSFSSLLITGGYLLIYLIYGWLIHQVILFIKFGYLFKAGLWTSLLICLRHMLQGILIAFVLGGFTLGIFLIFGVFSWVFTGILALVLQQTYPFIRSLFQVWNVTSQYQLWHTRSQKG